MAHPTNQKTFDCHIAAERMTSDAPISKRITCSV